MMKKFTAILLIIGFTSIAQANAKTLPIADFINKDTVSCKIDNDNQHQSFADLTTLLFSVEKNLPNIKGKPYKINENWITGIKDLSVNIQQKNNGVEKTKDISILVRKYGMTFLNVGAFDFKSQNSELSGNGYYFILTGNPKTNLAQLKKLGLADDESFIFETPEQQTRLNCFVTG